MTDGGFTAGGSRLRSFLAVYVLMALAFLLLAALSSVSLARSNSLMRGGGGGDEVWGEGGGETPIEISIGRSVGLRVETPIEISIG